MKKAFTNGVFDLFHEGHLNLLKKAKQYGDYLLVGVASDESCTQYKRKPLMSWEERANKIRELAFVDEVIKTPWSKDLTEEFYSSNKIDLQIQGDKGSSFSIAENLGLLKIVGTTEGISTTKLLNIISSDVQEIFEQGSLNDVKRVLFEGKYYVIKYGNRNVAKKYPISLPNERIKNEYNVIESFRKVVDDPSFIIKPISTDYLDFIIFESAPLSSETLFERLINEKIPNKVLLTSIVKKIALLHSNTYNNEHYKELFSENKGFLRIKIETQCLDATHEKDLRVYIENFIANSLEIKTALLHGDFAPKNILVWEDSFLFIDFEESGYADPALDIGYFLAHLLIHKVINGTPLWDGIINQLLKIYLSNYEYSHIDINLKKRIIKYMGVFLLSRVNSKAPATYIPKNFIKDILSLGRKLVLDDNINLN